MSSVIDSIVFGNPFFGRLGGGALHVGVGNGLGRNSAREFGRLNRCFAWRVGSVVSSAGGSALSAVVGFALRLGGALLRRLGKSAR